MISYGKQVLSQIARYICRTFYPLRAMILKFKHANHLKILLKQILGPICHRFRFHLEWELRICISNMLPSDATILYFSTQLEYIKEISGQKSRQEL